MELLVSIETNYGTRRVYPKCRTSRTLAEIAGTTYSLHMKETEHFVRKLYENLGAQIEWEKTYKFPLPHSQGFHSEEKKLIDVILVKAVR